MKHKEYLTGIVVGVLGVVSIFFLLPGEQQSAEASWREEARQEFKGAYDQNVQKGKTIEYTLVADESTIRIDETELENMWSYNGQFPGPMLEAEVGDILKVNLVNKLPQPTTIHWHGVRVENEMDGVPGVTQEAVQPGETFVYEFQVKDPGTFWYHPHVRSSEQIERGLYGVLIVKDKQEPEYDQDIALVLDDITLRNGKLYENFNTPHDLMHDGRWGNVLLVNGKQNPKIKVQAGERIRVRLINTSNGRVYRPNLRGLDAQVIAVDGMLVKEPFEYHSMDIAPGNRVDFDITIPKEGNFLLQDTFTRYTNTLASFVASGIVHEVKDFPTPSADILPEWNSIPLQADITYQLNARRGGEFGIQWTMNNQAYPNTSQFELASNEIVVIDFKNLSGRLHPMHIHGQFFKVIGRDGQRVNEGFWRDTVLVKPKENVTVAMIPLDKGTWMNHCHILEHAESGMMTTIQVN